MNGEIEVRGEQYKYCKGCKNFSLSSKDNDLCDECRKLKDTRAWKKYWMELESKSE